MKFRGLIFFVLLLLLIQCGPYQRSQSDKVFLEMKAFISLLEYDLQVLEDEIVNLGEEVKSLYYEMEQTENLKKAPNRKYNRGIYNNKGRVNPNASTIYISKLAEDDDAFNETLRFTEILDYKFKEIVDRYDVVSQVYFNSKHQVNQLFPPYDALSMLDPDHDLTSFNFYYLANEQNNPNAEAVWVDEIYIDPVGRGWVISLIHPVYVEEELIMILGFDITLNSIIGNYLDNFDRDFVLIDATGTLVAGKTRGIESLSLPPLKNHTYNQTISSDSFRVEDYNLFSSKSKEVRKMASQVILANKEEYVLNDYGLQANISAMRMNILDWIVLDLVF
jgi:hypothetical protein